MTKKILSNDDKRTVIKSFKLSPLEEQIFKENVRLFGGDQSSYLRDRSLGYEAPRRRRVTSLNGQMLGFIITLLSRYHGSIYQIQKKLNFGESVVLNQINQTINETNIVLKKISDLIEETRRGN